MLQFFHKDLPRHRWIEGFVYVADGYKTTEAINSVIPLDFYLGNGGWLLSIWMGGGYVVAVVQKRRLCNLAVCLSISELVQNLYGLLFLYLINIQV